MQSLRLGQAQEAAGATEMRRINKLPVIAAFALVAIFLAVLIYGLSTRGLSMRDASQPGDDALPPASTYADQLKRGVKDGIIGDPEPTIEAARPPIEDPLLEIKRPEPRTEPIRPEVKRVIKAPETEEELLGRLKREYREQYLREQQRQQLARLQAQSAALDSPLNVDIGDLAKTGATEVTEVTDKSNTTTSTPATAADLYQAALQSGAELGQTDPNRQTSKESFFNQDIQDLGYLPNKVVAQFSKFELKRGSVIPATLITGLNSDLPGRISAQVSQNVYDSATGRHLLVPQGAKLFGRYDSKLSFGQERVLVVWTDIIFPNGSTLQIGGMAGVDAEGYGGFKDKVDRHYLRTFGAAALVAIIGTGIDMSLPQSSTLATQETASDAARRNFAEVFGRAAERTISKNLDVQPTIRIRPGYRFNLLVEQDLSFPGAYRD
jgi:type IV secretion system protein VirB10